MEEKKDNKKKIIILGVITLIIVLLSTTFSFFIWNSNTNQDINVAMSLSGLDAYIHYNKGTDVLTGTLLPSTDYSGGISTEIELWKDPSAESRTIYGHIYMDITTIGTNLANEPALKWAITSNGEVLNTGDFVGQSDGNSIKLKVNIPLSTTKQLYQIYIWLDESMEINDAIEGETISTIVRAEATEVMYTAANDIESLLKSNPETMNNDDPDGNVRYMGANPNNYVSFNNELWRIIGVFNVKSSENGQPEKRIKIIRNESLGNMAWDSSNVNDWTQASLQEYLNGDYYNSLDSVSQSLIGDTYWNLGGTASYQSASNGLATHFYGYERGTTVYGNRPTYWVGKIGLMYPSDYGYATSGGITTNRQSCLAKELYNWDSSSYSDCKNNDYLYNSSSSLWTIAPSSSNSNNVFRVSSTGYVGSNVDASNSHGSAFPVLYLKSTVQITGGEGTSEKPYTLEGPPPPTATDTISSIFTSAEKTEVTNNNVKYQYAPSVGMMEDVGGNIRYYGADPNNYVSFNNELWRIIGVFYDIDDGTGKTETRIKIARSESIGNYQWDDNENEWPTATLNTYLNGTYLNSLSSESQAMVGNAKWNLGGSSTYQGLYANDYYTFERGTTVYSGRSTEWTGKIALMYPSDYMYAGDLSKCSKDGYNWETDQTNCRDTSWLRNTSTVQWTLAPHSSYSNIVFNVYASGSVNYYYVTYSRASRPVLFLASTVQITGGDGTSGNPFTLG